MTEQQLQEICFRLLTMADWRFSHFHDSRRQVRPGVFVGDSHAKGFPDVLAVRGERVIAAEFKSASGKVRPEQQAWLDDLNGAGVEARVVRPVDLEDFAMLVQRRRR